MSADKLVVGLAGMPGSGKSLVVETAMEEGFSVVIMGDVVRSETRKRGLELNPQNIGRVMLELRAEGGAGVIADKCVLAIEEAQGSKVIVDGLRSLSEAEVFRARFPRFVLVAVHSSPEARFNRLYRRRRSDDPDGWGVFRERDLRELSVGLGGAIAMAEYLVVNEEGKDAARAEVRKVLGRIEARWVK
jgi:dephospho-CoA kinase